MLLSAIFNSVKHQFNHVEELNSQRQLLSLTSCMLLKLLDDEVTIGVEDPLMLLFGNLLGNAHHSRLNPFTSLVLQGVLQQLHLDAGFDGTPEPLYGVEHGRSTGQEQGLKMIIEISLDGLGMMCLNVNDCVCK